LLVGEMSIREIQVVLGNALLSFVSQPAAEQLILIVKWMRIFGQDREDYRWTDRHADKCVFGPEHARGGRIELLNMII